MMPSELSLNWLYQVQYKWRRVYKEFSPASHILFKQVFAPVQVSFISAAFLGTMKSAVPWPVPRKVPYASSRPSCLTSARAAWGLCSSRQFLNLCMSSEFLDLLRTGPHALHPYFPSSESFSGWRSWVTWEGTTLQSFQLTYSSSVNIIFKFKMNISNMVPFTFSFLPFVEHTASRKRAL